MLPNTQLTPVYTPSQSVPIQKTTEKTGTAGEIGNITSVSNTATEEVPSTFGIRGWLWGALGSAASSIAFCPIGTYRMVRGNNMQRALQDGNPAQEPSAVEMQPLNVDKSQETQKSVVTP